MQQSQEKQRRSRAERLGLIIDLLLTNGSVSVSELEKTHHIPERTARADLLALSQLRPRKAIGGLSLAGSIDSTFHSFARTKFVAEKVEVASIAASEFSPTGSIAASAGSTVSLTISALEEHRIAPVVVTNSLAIADSCPNVSFLHLVGGQYDAQIHALVGTEAVRGFQSGAGPFLQGLVGISGVTVQGGDVLFYVRHHPEVSVLQAMLNRVSRKIVFVADASKLGQADTWNFANLNGLLTNEREVVLVTNSVQRWQNKLGQHYKAAKETHDALMLVGKTNFKVRTERDR